MDSSNDYQRETHVLLVKHGNILVIDKFNEYVRIKYYRGLQYFKIPELDMAENQFWTTWSEQANTFRTTTFPRLPNSPSSKE